MEFFLVTAKYGVLGKMDFNINNINIPYMLIWMSQ